LIENKFDCWLQSNSKLDKKSCKKLCKESCKESCKKSWKSHEQCMIESCLMLDREQIWFLNDE